LGMYSVHIPLRSTLQSRREYEVQNGSFIHVVDSS
jgi:hypothetical protein